MSRQGKLIASEADATGLTHRRHILTDTIQRHQQELLAGIRVYLWRLGVATDRMSLEQCAEEILQETVVQALQHAGNYEPGRPARAWLLGVAINEIRHRRRTIGLEQRILTPVADTTETHSAARSSDLSGLSETDMFDLLYKGASVAASRYTLEEILSVVDESDQKVLRLHFVDGLSGRELAAALGTSEGYAYTQLSRVKARLRQAFLGQSK